MSDWMNREEMLEAISGLSQRQAHFALHALLVADHVPLSVMQKAVELATTIPMGTKS